MNKKEKGFTLVELLAVIVILGLLMAIAIPSVTKYIVDSRKKTLTQTIGGYLDALTNEVNDAEYKFSDSSKIYAVPIECISLEKGGTDPFGEWLQSDNNYWAYVLVQYDNINYNYKYGFTFKDSAGYGIYPTTNDELKPDGSQIRTDLGLTRPANSYANEYLEEEKWIGFNIEEDTELIVLESTSEGETGDNISTCTLVQKGDNYESVEEFKKTALKAYAIYSADDKSLTFIRTSRELKVGYKHYGKTITGLYTGFETKGYGSGQTPWFSYAEEIKRVEFKNKISPLKTTWWFSGFNNCEYLDVGNLDTSNTTDISYMFYFTGRYVNNFKIVGLEKWDVSKVITTDNMFRQSGMRSKTWDIGNISNWNTKNVTNMRYMFFQTATGANFTLDLRNWDVSKVTNHDNFNTMIENKVLAPNFK